MIGRKIAYIAGPYRAETHRGVHQNIRRAVHVGVQAARKGYAILVPHANSHMPELFGNLGDEYWLDADIDLLIRCDVVVLVDGWRASRGTLREIEHAKAHGIPVYELEELPDADS